MAKKITKPKAEKAKKAKYSLEVDVNEGVYRGKADTLEQVLNDFVASENFPKIVKTRVLFKISDGTNKIQQNYFLGSAQRMFRRMRVNASVAELMAYKFMDRLNG